ncbi:hypothetical protein FGADI_12046 [Fusarium gaditjirri]|uniref:Methyltransferase n=1 Tax=Fusarium gaditjirri TaxID=282569 RepID=A0A8H4ST12_9HYPO|nr:hypothetical protein FGADI_12046 [Fusarium gaditjirri]
MSSPSRTKRADSGSASSTPPGAEPAESGLLPPEHWSQLPATAVDIGTGTGIWAMEFADRFPNASVIGTDLAPIQPGWIPPNLEFQIEDCTQEWTFQPNSFDYIHMRWLVGSIADWKSLFKEAYKCLKPGGYIESYEPSSRVESDDGTVLPDSALSQWEKFFVEGGRKIGRPFTIFEENIQREGMKEAGFVDIEERDFKASLPSRADVSED